MKIEYDIGQPGDMKIFLYQSDLNLIEQNGHAFENGGFEGPDSSTWVHVPLVKNSISSQVHPASAEIDHDGELHVRLARDFVLPIEIDRSAIAARPGMTERYLGATGIILVQAQID